MDDKFFTMDEVSKYLKIPKSTIYKLSQKGKIPSIKIGKQLRFRKSSLDKWLTEKEHQNIEPRTENREPKHILLIDDEYLVLRAVTKLLETNGYNVQTATSGYEALERVEKSNFDLVITDVRMPGMDGLETIKRIREFNASLNKSQAQEIIITGYTDATTEQQAEQLGIKDYVYKPFLNEEFLSIVRKKTETASN